MKKEDIREVENPTPFAKYFAGCSKCDKVILGSTKDQVIYNMARHIDSKICKSRSFELRVQAALPPRTPGYQSPVSQKEDAAVSKIIDKMDELSDKTEKTKQ